LRHLRNKECRTPSQSATFLFHKESKRFYFALPRCDFFGPLFRFLASLHSVLGQVTIAG
jgi:hypothetical protein